MSTSVTSSHQAEVTVDTATIEVITGIAAGVVSPDAPARAHVVWSEADTGLWAANYGGYYGGVVDQQGAHFFVADTYGQYVGDFRSLHEAQDRLAERLHELLPNVRRTLD
ncbi:hypothetical protein NY588_00840 [Curtobacterium flaccumfaciens pv. beticola]|uniref:hypothetical protein n=1 Tax=Curtobacterium flaccumfaciens TaxID=2035 RepID=UPI00349F2CCD|nr:hypothetical protein [Curtobacterium flaccumfaciens pv. basellae]